MIYTADTNVMSWHSWKQQKTNTANQHRQTTSSNNKASDEHNNKFVKSQLHERLNNTDASTSNCHYLLALKRAHVSCKIQNVSYLAKKTTKWTKV